MRGGATPGTGTARNGWLAGCVYGPPLAPPNTAGKALSCYAGAVPHLLRCTVLPHAVSCCAALSQEFIQGTVDAFLDSCGVRTSAFRRFASYLQVGGCLGGGWPLRRVRV